ncbi:hypothetical protein [Synechococcus elongatus]|uniref:Uncharacterized protein n=1 Tax=Synechococcus elongatus PCC 11801 TaxID=2219813 RepID=A0AAN1QQ06_SYNEL|nr:hypothetical protein [Synechococcus elongatus]AZB73391.1 hypothetical protein DOP62_12340 [Synechococcus elongatus PCC 11801]
MSTIIPISQGITSAETFVPMPRQWVQLRDRCSEYSADQALLMCEAWNDAWVAWVPDHGEVTLQRHQFLQHTNPSSAV